MAQSKNPPKTRDSFPKLPAKQTPAKPAPAASSHGQAIRETVESIVIAFVLAFLFRTFEAEAFVIPTGSMAPTLMGAHKDVFCSQCGHRFRVNASEEDSDELRQARSQEEASRMSCYAGECPSCRYVMLLRTDGLPPNTPELHDSPPPVNEPIYNGDRILVNKYVYTVHDPDRWDVVVFHFPGNAQMNYIKRLVGLPGETIRIDQGDLFVGPNDAKGDSEFTIARKPAEKLLAMRQLVHDTDYDAAELYNANWPLRWRAADNGAASAWKTDAKVEGKNVRERFTVDAAGDEPVWLRYQHLIPSYDDWRNVINRERAGASAGSALPTPTARPQLITDFNAYNSRVSMFTIQHNPQHDLRPEVDKLGVHWVGDLMVEADIDVESTSGKLLVDLVEGGRHFTCTFDLASGQAALAIDGLTGYEPTAKTALKKPGRYHVAFANCDEQLLLWVDGRLVEFNDGTEYDAKQIFGPEGRVLPQTSAADPGDLAPAGIGAAGAKLAVTRLQVWRDIYYIARSWDSPRTMEMPNLVSDFERIDPRTLAALPRDPSLWNLYRERRTVEFPLSNDQFFVMGDNSAESSDARLWCDPMQASRGRPGGPYLERRLLIGKALCVYWPHSWNRIPGTPIPFPLFPNFADMRLVR